ncbi:hypothetical protein CVD28_00445 [Bacillus sp. M6-12]|uniref:hypothetical protein n=1 Tax=Bacillus sp. M6-12 TaxID=2054166 RepID=UPI000C78D7EF|nr:hypothetical protein [Bacillus sp. M6-12]PLS18904.1 hypothetical protein CVD28_00445 [Bacillus sp. M6-12]
MQEHTTNPQWVMGYKEMKNFMHNELGITKDEMKDIFHKIAREEIKEAVGQNGEFIRYAIKEIIREEMMFAIQQENYPRMSRNIYDYSRNSQSPFTKFISDILKEQIIEMLRSQFNVDFNIQKKEKDEEEEKE